ncbi:MAG: acyl-CoA dehydrogenase C-terminal domain-containing protein, partial [Acidimicrobiia bacterium]
DLVMRKLPMNNGAVVEAYLDEIGALDAELEAAGAPLADVRSGLAAALTTVRTATTWLNTREDVSERMAGATPYQDMLGTLAGGYYLARQAVAALPGASDDTWLAAKVSTATFYARNILPTVHGLADAVTAGADILFSIDDAHIGASA